MRAQSPGEKVLRKIGEKTPFEIKLVPAEKAMAKTLAGLVDAEAQRERVAEQQAGGERAHDDKDEGWGL